ncbi:hypothetical protein Glove_735g2 [Diversispora epigaea]|uniref:Uncharacterized protein n=1 Tax=Diversispora epigaea TaxID=1348612 RepID=A0A397G014_9GLOM|nr:hypothetical protein Glove_735g2 [Diversispora epigaea]
MSHTDLEEAISSEIFTPLPLEVPDCFKARGLEKDWSRLIKEGRDFRREDWYSTHIHSARREGITPLEHLAEHLKHHPETDTEDEDDDQEEQ